MADRLKGLWGNKNAIAETIENNVRSKIVKKQLSDPAFFEKMSALLDEIIAARKTKALAYEKYLQRIAELAAQVEAGHGTELPNPCRTARHSGPCTTICPNQTRQIATTSRP